MKRWCVGMLFAITAAAAPQLAGQDMPKWEYGRLFARHGVPMVWLVGAKSTEIDSGGAVYVRTANVELQILRGEKPRDPPPNELTPAALLMTTMNRLGAEGWELVSIIPSPPIFTSGKPQGAWEEVEYFFKRPKTKP